MFINNKHYQTDLVDINKIRYLLFTNFYSNANYIVSLTEIINNNIECIGIDYSSMDYTFTIKIKKTAMRKSYHGFRHNPNFYYHNTISNIFRQFLKTHENEVIRILSTEFENPNYVLESIYNNDIMTNLCHITCISDNIIMMKL